MTTQVIRRLLQTIPTLIGVSIVLVLIFHLIPGNFVDSNPTISKERATELKEMYGLNDPVHIKYIKWTQGVLKGDLGYSISHKQPVTTIIDRYVWNSVLIAGAVMVLSWIIAIIVGVFSAVRQHSFFDGVITFLVFAVMSLPSFFLGLLAIKLFAVDMRIFPIGGMTTTGANYEGWAHVWDVLEHMILPVIVLTALNVGGLTRYFRTSMLDVIKQDFIRTARAKGLKERTVIFKHALRNAMIPAITLLGFEIPSLFAGAMITESIFNWPGIGGVFLDAITARDYFLMLGYTFFIAFLTIIGNVVADLMYRVVDPRVRMK
ncbi:ABC transporter permease [Paenibacillus agilis]|uniref:ABC transporter permease n=1 Tax=Paenibacillus agilis TaxID=3020863 RepID=A0A559J3I3_9BACL|nr:ABC transporter permease [Paenibacillus agilis]TVX94448.1 ABC transporter permease [Paenibacillus agilis]